MFEIKGITFHELPCGDIITDSPNQIDFIPEGYKKDPRIKNRFYKIIGGQPVLTKKKECNCGH